MRPPEGTDGTRYVKVYEPLSCSADELGIEPCRHSTIMVEVVDTDSKWTNVVEGMTAYPPEQLKQFLDEAGFTKTEIYRKKPSYATILGVKP